MQKEEERTDKEVSTVLNPSKTELIEEDKLRDGNSPRSENPENKNINNPNALLNAYERVKEEKKRLIREKEALEKKYQGIDLETYTKLIEQQQFIEQQKLKVEEDKLIQEQNWEALVTKKVNQIEEQYKLKLEKANADLNQINNQFVSAENLLKEQNRQIDELRRQFIAYNSFIAHKGKPESFKYVWEGELRSQTSMGEQEQLLLLKGKNAEEILFDGEGNIVDINKWRIALL
jgi:hypothetical protein